MKICQNIARKLVSVLLLTVAFTFLVRGDVYNVYAQDTKPANDWRVYRDSRYDFSLAVPSEWNVSPAPLDGIGTFVVSNYDPNQASGPLDRSPQAIQLEITVFPLSPGQTVENWVDEFVRQQTQSELGQAQNVQLVTRQSTTLDGRMAVKLQLDSSDYPPVLYTAVPYRGRMVLLVSIAPANSEAFRDAELVMSTLELDQGQLAIPPVTPAPLDVILAEPIPAQEIHPCGDWGREAADSPIALYMPFQDGETWVVGGDGSFYGDYMHNNIYNAYYATDWNMPGQGNADEGKYVLPVANGQITECRWSTASGLGNYVTIDHPNGVRTTYAHLQTILISPQDCDTGQAIDHWTPIGKVGRTGTTGAHLHLWFRVNEYSHCYDSHLVYNNNCGGDPQQPQSPKPSPMNTQSGIQTLCDGYSYVSNNKRDVGNLLLDLTTSLGRQSQVEIVVTSVGDPDNQLSQNSVTTDSQGNYKGLPLFGCVEAGKEYDIYVKPDGYLRQKQSNIRLQPGTNHVTFSSPFQKGDIAGNDDNAVNTMDLIYLLEKWHTDDPAADLNEDGNVNVNDLVVLMNNWGAGEGWTDRRDLKCGPAAADVQSPIGAQDAYGTITLSPAGGTFDVGDTFDMQVFLDTAGHEVDGVDLIMHYDPGVLEMQDADPLTGTQISDGGIFAEVRRNRVDSEQGEILFAANVGDETAPPYQGSGTLATARFRVLNGISTTAVRVYYQDDWTAETNLVENETVEDVLAQADTALFQTVGSPSRPMPSLSFTPASNTVLNSSLVPLEADVADAYDQVREVGFEVKVGGEWKLIGSDSFGPHWRYTWDASALPDGAYDLRVSALLLGGEGTIVVNDNIVLDRKQKLFLPHILKSSDGSSPPGGKAIRGTVTDNGMPAEGLEILLRYDDGPTWSTYATTTTDSNGYYQFTDLPDLGPDQKMYVRWNHEGYNLSQLWLWRCWFITPDNMNDPDAYRCNFDVSEVYLQSPDRWATISLPYTFTWKKRIVTSDNYLFYLGDIYDGNPEWWYPLAYEDSYTLSSLPEGFVPGEEYAWWLRVYGPDGYGISYAVYEVTFSNTGTGLQGESPPASPPIEDDDEAGMRPQVR